MATDNNNGANVNNENAGVNINHDINVNIQLAPDAIEEVQEEENENVAEAPAERTVTYGASALGKLTGDDDVIFTPYPAFFNRGFDRLINTIHAGGVNVNLTEILRKAGSESFRNADYVDSIRKNVARHMYGGYESNQNIAMSDIAASFFECAYKEIVNEAWGPKDKIINAQKIADLLLKNYSPIAYEGSLGRYADNYVLNNRELLRERLKKLNVVPENEIESLIQEVAPLGEVAPEIEVNEQKTVIEAPQQENVIEAPQQETVVEEPQQVVEEIPLAQEEKIPPVSVNPDEQSNNDTQEEPVEEEVVIPGVSVRNKDDNKDMSFAWTEELYDELDELYEDNYEIAKETKGKVVEVLTDIEFRYLGNSLMTQKCFTGTAMAYNSLGYSAKKVYMSQVASQFFKKAYEGINVDKSLDGATKIVAAQKIADIVIKNYFPMVNNKGFERFANNYMLRNDKYLEKMMVEARLLSEDDAERLIQEAKEELDIGPEIEQEVTEEIPNVEINEQENIIEEPQQETVIEAPQQEIVVEEPVQEIVKNEPELVKNEPEPEQNTNAEQENVVEEPVQEIAKEEIAKEEIVQEPVQEPVQEIAQDNKEENKIIVDEQPKKDEANQNPVEKQNTVNKTSTQKFSYWSRNAAPMTFEWQKPQARQIFTDEEIKKFRVAPPERQKVLSTEERLEAMRIKLGLPKEPEKTEEIKESEPQKSTMDQIFDLNRQMFDSDELKRSRERDGGKLFTFPDVSELQPDIKPNEEAPLAPNDQNADNENEVEEEQNENVMEEPEQDVNDGQKIAAEESLQLDIDYAQWLNDRIDSREVQSSVYAELSAIMESAGVTDNAQVDETIGFIQQYVSATMSAHNLDWEEPDMQEVAARFFEESYSTIAGTDLEPKDRIMTAQKVADVMLKNYSPVALSKEELGQYADNFMLKNRELLQERLANFGVHDVEELLNNDGAVIEGEREPEINNEQRQENNVIDNADAVANNDPEPQPIYVPDLQKRLNERMDSKNIAAEVKDELGEIIRSVGVKDPERVSKMVEETYNHVIDEFRTLYDAEGARPKTHYAVVHVFNEAYMLLRDNNLSLEAQTVAAQKITNVMVKNYSPVALIDKQFDHYADNYIVNDNELLRDHLKEERIPDDQIEAKMQEVREAIVNGVKLAPEPEEVNVEVPVVENAPVEQDNDPQAEEEDPVIADMKDRGRAEDIALNWNLNNNHEIYQVDRRFIKMDDLKKEIGDDNEKYVGLDNMFEETVAVADDKLENRVAMVEVFKDKIKEFNSMYKVNINADKFAADVSDAWTKMRSKDEKAQAEGKKMLGNLFKSTLKTVFDKERDASYNEHRLPEYTDIIRSSDELLKSSMYAFTDAFSSRDGAALYNSTAFGGLNEREMARLTKGESLWSMDQKSDAAWEIQCKGAKDLAAEWMKADKPHVKALEELDALMKAKQEGIVDRKELLDKLTAAEWMFTNDDKLMIEDPEDPYSKIPNWGNKYWKKLTETREALGIDKHSSMRDIIQSEYAASARAVNSVAYNRQQIYDYAVDPNIRVSMEDQLEQFAMLSAKVDLTELSRRKEENVITKEDEDLTRVRLNIPELNQREIMKNEPKLFTNMVIDKANELEIDRGGNDLGK